MKAVPVFLFLLAIVSCAAPAGKTAQDSMPLPLQTTEASTGDTTSEVMFSLVPDETEILYGKVPCPSYLDTAFHLAGIHRPDSICVNYYYEKTSRGTTRAYLRTAEFCSFQQGEKGDASVMKFLSRKKKFNRDFYSIVGFIDLVDRTIRIRLVTVDSWDTWCIVCPGDTSFCFHEKLRELPQDYPLSTDQSKPLPEETVFQSEWPDERHLTISTQKIRFPDFNREVFRMAGLIPPDSIVVNTSRFSSGENHTTIVYPRACFEDFYSADTASGLWDIPAAYALLTGHDLPAGCSASFDLLSETIEYSVGEGGWVERHRFFLADEGVYELIEGGHQNNQYTWLLNGRELLQGNTEGYTLDIGEATPAPVPAS